MVITKSSLLNVKSSRRNTVFDITKILYEAPNKIAEFCELENRFYALMIQKHEEYKRAKAKLYLEKKAQGQITSKDLEYELDCNSDLCFIKDTEIQAEISYRAARAKKERAEHLFNSAVETGRNQRAELYSLNDSIKENRP